MTIPRRTTLPAVLLPLLALTPASDTAADVGPRPNVLIILTDDQRADLMSVMPQTLASFGDEGVTYTNGLANTPLCCPARASIFTGRFAHNHGVTSNSLPADFDHDLTMQRHLQEAGYRTGIVGKYFNGWDVREDPPFFDRWAVTNELPTFNVDGAVMSVDQYATDYMAGTAEQLIRDFEAQGPEPWFLHVATTAPHLPVSVAPEYQSAPVSPWQPSPSVSRPIDPEVTDGTRRMLMSVDDLVGQLFDVLEELGEADDTLVFFASDNGFMWSEHGLWAKNKPHTESIRVPFFARWPGHLPAGAIMAEPVAHVDIAPTILEAAGLPLPSSMDGGSLLAGSPRTDMLTEGWYGDGSPAWASLRTAGYQYIEWFGTNGQTVKARAFYRLDEDPWQMANLLADDRLAGDPDVASLHERVGNAMACTAAACAPALTSTSIEVDDVVTPEASDVVFRVTLSPATDQAVEVAYATRDGSAASPGDYSDVSGTLVIPAGQTSGQVMVPTVSDVIDEPDENFFLDLSSGLNATVIDSTGVATIVDDDETPPPVAAISDAAVGESGPAVAFLVTLSSAASQQVSVAYATAPGTATAGKDYQRVMGTLKIPAGETAGTILVPVSNDALDEPDETLLVTLSAPSGATLADGQATGTIVDDDEPPPSTAVQISISDTSAGEGQASMAFAISLSAASSGPVTVAYATAPSTATAGRDYTRIAGILKIPAGQTASTITVPLLDDLIDEPDETVSVTISSPSGATITDGQAVGTLVDDDPSP